MVWGRINSRSKIELWINTDWTKVNSIKCCDIIEDFAKPFVELGMVENQNSYGRAISHTSRFTQETPADYNYSKFTILS